MIAVEDAPNEQVNMQLERCRLHVIAICRATREGYAMYETVVYIEVVADGVYPSVPGRRRPVPGSNDVSGGPRAKTQSSVYHGDRKLRTCDNRATFVLHLILRLHSQHLPSSNGNCLRTWQLRLSKF